MDRELNNQPEILFTGGAGYIGSHCYHLFHEAGFRVIVIDSLKSGYRWLLPRNCDFYKGDASDVQLLDRIFSNHSISTVLHFAGSSQVAESVVNPLAYYKNNTNVSRILVNACIQNDVKNFIFSSSASVYGDVSSEKVTESDAVSPKNPYAMSKLAAELVIKDVHAVSDLNCVLLRYFNVAGADTLGRIGQVTKNATHLIKVACEAALGQRAYVPIYGDDYDTLDGTCIRDYIHVSDIASAHMSAYQFLQNNSNEKISETFNCGYGVGYSVKQIIDVISRVSRKNIITRLEPRRMGDSQAVVADSSKLMAMTDWKPRHNDLEMIVQSALNWETTHTIQSMAG